MSPDTGMGKKCEGCGTPIAGSGKFCITCFGKYVQDCDTCLDKNGRLAYRYQMHEGDGHPGEDGWECRRCGEKHDDDRKKVCPTCKNERYVWTGPERKGKS